MGRVNIKHLIEDIYALSPMQQGMLFHTLYESHSGMYIEQFRAHLSGEIDIPAFRRAWELAVENHSILRTAFLWEDLDEPLQMVFKKVTLPFTEYDWRSLDEREQQNKLRDFFEKDRLSGFDLRKPPLMRLTLIRVAEQEFRFIWTHHHLLLDAWSGYLLLKEVFSYYNALSQNRTPRPEREIAYRNYIAWLRQQDLKKAETFWRRELKDFPSPTPLVVDGKQEVEREPADRFEELVFELPDLSAELAAFSQTHHLTPGSIVQAAWAILLSRYNHRDDVLYGTTVSGRPPDLPGVEKMVGLFINTLPVRVKVEANRPVLSFLKSLQEKLAEMREYEYTPLSRIQSWSEVPRGSALFESLLVSQGTLPMDSLREAISRFEIKDARLVERTNYPLTIAFETEEVVRFRIIYDTRRFEAATISRLMGHMETLMQAMVRVPQNSLASLPLLTNPEWQQIVTDWNATEMAYPGDLPIHRLFEEIARKTPDSVAVTWQERRITYRELNERAGVLAAHLQESGVKPGDTVGILTEPSVEMVVAMLAVLKTGGAYLPLDVDYPEERLIFMLQDTGAPVLLTRRNLSGKIRNFPGKQLFIEDFTTGKNRPGATFPSVTVKPDHPAYIIYTSGSTGLPKGVIVPHRAVIRLVKNTNYISLNSSDRIAQVSNFSFDAATFEIWGALLCGGRLVIIDRDTLLLPEKFVQQLNDHKITALFLTTALFNQIARDVPVPPQTLRYLLFGGEAVDPQPVREFLEKGFSGQLLHVYGPTENTTFTTYHPVTEVPENARTVPIGKPISNTRVYLLDSRGQPVPVGVPGEIHVGGDGLALGYLNRPELTGEKFIPDSFSDKPGSRLYKTGDLGRYLPDGSIEFIGRLDNQVKIRGFRVEPGEIEALLIRHPGVENAAVQLWKDEDGQKRLVAYLVPKAGGKPEVRQLRRFLKKQLPDYMIPAFFVFLKSFPLTPNGKIDRSALPPPDRSQLQPEHRFAAPRTEAEKTLAKIWAEVLHLDQVGIHDNFFELGGDSILSIQIVARANQAGLRFTPRLLFEHPTIAELIPHIRKSDGREDHGVVTGTVPLTPVQRWFFRQNFPDPHHWNQALWLEVEPDFNVPTFKDALIRLISHHDALRMRFVKDDGGWQQFISPPTEQAPFLSKDLSGLNPQEQERALKDTAAEVQGSLNLSDGPLLRVVYFRFGETVPGQLLIVIHHLVVDGVSWRILLEDLYSLYRQLNEGRAPALPGKTASFKQWAEKLTEYARGSQVKDELNFWKKLADLQIAPLPRDIPDGENSEASADTITVSLGPEETGRLLKKIPYQWKAHINDLLLTALSAALSRWVKSSKILIDLEGHGREEIFPNTDVSRTVGWFTSIYPVPLSAEAQDNPDDRLRSVKTALREIPRNGIGFGILRYLSNDSRIEQELAKIPGREIAFNYLGQFDQVFPSDAPFRILYRNTGPLHSPRAQRPHLLEIVGYVSDGRLYFHWNYSRNIHHESTIKTLAKNFEQALRDLLTTGRIRRDRIYIPSDFPLARLSPPELRRILKHHPQLEDIYPLTPLQQGMFFHSLSQENQNVYITQLCFTLHGSIRNNIFKQAWEAVVKRHSILRSAFVWEDLSEPLQIVHHSVNLSWEEMDWSKLPADEQRHKIDLFLRSDRETGFDFSQPPLMRFFLIKTASRVFKFIWTHHHLLLDGWSLSPLWSEILHFYEALNEGKEIHMPPPTPYRSYIAWLKQQDMKKAETFWRNRLKGFRSPTPLPFSATSAEPEPPEGDFNLVETTFSPQRTENLLSFVREHRLTLNTVIQATWALLLSHYSGEKDVLFGATVSGRPAGLKGVESMVGLFINTLPIRVRVSEHQPLSEWIKELQEQQSGLREYEYTPLALIQKWSELPPGASLFQSIIIFENYPVINREKASRRKIEIRNVRSMGWTNYPLTLLVMPNRGLRFIAKYDTRKFNRDAVQKILSDFRTLLGKIVEQPQQELSALIASSLKEKIRSHRARPPIKPPDLFIEFPRKDTRYSIVRRFEQQVEKYPDNIAVRTPKQQWTYDQLNRRANGIAKEILRVRGSGTERVALLFEPGPEMMAGILGVLKAGKTYVPLDPGYPEERLAYIIRDARIDLIVSEEKNLPLARKLAGEKAQILNTSTVSEKTENPELTIRPADLAYILYTSGSTGTPKGVMQSHRNVLHHIRNYTNNLKITPRDRLSLLSSYGFDAAIMDIFGALLNGATLCPFDLKMEGIEKLAPWMIEEGITIYHSTPTVYRYFIRSLNASMRFDNIRFVVLGGEEVLKTDLENFKKHFSHECIFINGFGPTECTVGLQFFADHNTVIHTEKVPIGYPVEGVEVQLIGESGESGAHQGEIAIKSPYVALGYWQKPDLTRRVFSNHFKKKGMRLYRTGDLGRFLPDGSLEYVGRKDNQVKIRGYRVEIGEIESKLLEMEAIREAVVIARKDDAGQYQLSAFIVFHKEKTVPVPEIRKFLLTHLPDYMIPGTYHVLDALPLTPTGKVDRLALQTYRPSVSGVRKPTDSPRSEMEKFIAETWKDVLGVDHITVNDNFFDLGGHSLLAMSVVAKIEKKIGYRLNPRLLAFHTLEQLAEICTDYQNTSHSEKSPKITHKIITSLKNIFKD